MQQARDNQDPEHEDHEEQESSSEVSGASAIASEGESQGPSRVLGLTRWVQYVFVVIGIALLWVLDRSATLILRNFMEPNPEAVTAGSLIIAGIVAQRLYANEKTHRYVQEVVGELAKVTWPSREETYASSVIVIVTSLIAAAIVGGFDFVWSAITDLLYKYKV